MRINRPAVTAFLCMLISLSAAQKKVTAPRVPVLLLSRPVEATALGAITNAWFSALSESYCRLRLQPVDGIELVPLEDLRKTVPGFANFGRSVPQSDLLSAAKKLNATHILSHTYEVDNKAGSAYYYMELIEFSGNSVVVTFEKNFSLGQFEASLDEAIGRVLETLKITPSAIAKKAMKAPLVSTDARSVQALGTVIFEAQEVDPSRAAQEFVKLVSKEPKMGLAYYEAARRFAAIPDYAQAAKMLDNLVVQCNLSYPALFASIAAYYRLNKSYDRALHFITRAEKEGWSDLTIALEKAQVMELTGKADEALAAYTRVLAIDPDQPDALLLVARRERVDKKYSAAIAKTDRLIAAGKHVSAALREKGLALAALNKASEAQKTLLQALSHDPEDPDINIALGDILRQAGKHIEAAQYYEKALQKRTNDLNVLLSVSRSFVAGKRPQDALAVLMKHQQSFYTSKELLREMGLLEYELKDTASARKRLETSISHTPPDGRAFMALGNIYAATGQGAKAIPMFERAEELVDDKLEPRAALARLYLEAGNAAKAMTYVTRVLKDQPNYPQANRIRGDLLMARKDYQNALKAYLDERRHHGNDAYVQFQVGLCYYEMNNLANAELGLRKAVELDPKNADSYHYLAIISLRQGKLDEVRTFAAQAEVLGKSDPTLYHELAKAFMAKKQFDSAADAFLANLKADAKNVDAATGLANAYEQMKKDSLAADAWYRVYQLNPDTYSGYLARAGHLMYKIGNTTLAKKLYNEFLGKKLSDPEVSINSARMAFAEKKYPEVITLLAPLSGPKASDAEVLEMLATAYTASDKNTDALVVLERLAALKSTDAATLETAAQAFEKAGDLKKATLYYQRYLALPAAPKKQQFSFHLGELLEQAKQHALAIEQYQRNISQYPQDYRNHERLGELMLNANQITNLVKLLAPASTRSGVPARVNLHLAQAYVRQRNAQDAAVAYERYLSVEQKDSTAWNELGNIYYTNKMYDKAATAFGKASLLMPKNTDALQKLGLSLYHTKRLVEAADPLGRALAAGIKDPALLQALSECYRSLKDTTRLIGVLQERLAIESGNFEVANELGTLLFSRGELDRAITALSAASRAKPTDVGLHMQLVQLYAKKGDPKMQAQHINAAFSYAPDNAEVVFTKAHFHLMNNQPDDARTYLARTIKLDPKHTRALGLYGSMMKGERKYREAFDLFSQANKIDPDNVLFMLEMAQCAHLTGRNTVAIKVITRALEREPSNPAVLQWAGIFHLREANEEQALNYLTKALQLDNTCAQCVEYLGHIYLSRGQFDNAIQYLDQAARLSDRNDNVLVKLARAVMLSGDPDRAVALCNKALALNPQNDEALYLLCAIQVDRGQVANAQTVLNRASGNRTSGWIYLAQGKIAEAQNDLTSALAKYRLAARVLSANSDMQMGLGRVFLAQGKYGEAIEAFGVASGLEPNNPQVFIGMGRAYAGRKDFAAAKELFKEAVRISPKDETGYLYLGEAAAMQGESMEAITTVRSGIEQSPRSGKLHLLLGKLLAHARQHDDALDAFQKAARFESELSAMAFKEIGDIYYRVLKDVRNAKRFYQRHISAGGNDPGVRQALKHIDG